MTFLVDIGVNLASSKFRQDFAAVLSRARAAGVRTLVATGTSLEASAEVTRLAQESSGAAIYATAGVHPHWASGWTAEVQRRIAGFLQRPRVVAVGETGLDYNRMFSTKGEQRRAFEAHLALSEETGRPLFLHCRDAFDDFTAMLSAHTGPRGVVHCFTGTPAQAEQLLALGFDLGVTGWVSDPRRGHDLRESVAMAPLNRLHLETDAPYLRPANAPKEAGGRNEPSMLPFVAQTVAELKGLPVEEVCAACMANSQRLFGLETA